MNLGSKTHSPDESVTGNNAPVQVVRFMLPKETRDLVVGTILALSIWTNWTLWSKLHDAEKDVQTYHMLRDDALTKFEQGPFADVKARVLSLERDCREK